MRTQHLLRRVLLHVASLVLVLVAAERIEAGLIVNGGFETFVLGLTFAVILRRYPSLNHARV